jgi:hypothetical protein
MRTRIAEPLRLMLLTPLPMAGAVLGAMLDQRHHQGFTTWRSACRSAGLRFSTLVDFTLQLLPMAVIGLLLGGLVVLLSGALMRDRHARLCIAAHAGCAVTLPAALVLCAFLPPMWMLTADLVLAAAAAGFMLALLRTPSRAAGAHP